MDLDQPFECRKVKRDPTRNYTREQLNALDCSDGIACYEQQQQYNSAVVEFNNAEEKKYQDSIKEWELHDATITKWDKDRDSIQRELQDQPRELPGRVTQPYNSVKARCSRELGTGWINRDSSRWSPTGNRLLCFRTQNQIDREVVERLGYRPIVHPKPSRGRFDYRHQNKTEATIACCSNYVNVGNGNVSDFRQECNMKLQNITQSTGELEAPAPTTTTPATPATPATPSNNNTSSDEYIDDEKAKKKRTTIIILAITIPVVLIFLLFIIWFFFIRKKMNININNNKK
jgi:hypothetical protein